MQQNLSLDNVVSTHQEINLEVLDIRTLCNNCGQSSDKHQLCKLCVDETNNSKRKLSLFVVGTGVSSLMSGLINQNNSIFSISIGLFIGIFIHNMYTILKD